MSLRLQYFVSGGETAVRRKRGEGSKVFSRPGMFSTDLHSMGQYIQDGMRQIFETVLYVKNQKAI